MSKKLLLKRVSRKCRRLDPVVEKLHNSDLLHEFDVLYGNVLDVRGALSLRKPITCQQVDDLHKRLNAFSQKLAL